MNEEARRDLREKLSLATKGPWVADGWMGRVTSTGTTPPGRLVAQTPATSDGEWNTHLIAAMHEALPALLDDLEAAERPSDDAAVLLAAAAVMEARGREADGYIGQPDASVIEILRRVAAALQAPEEPA